MRVAQLADPRPEVGRRQLHAVGPREALEQDRRDRIVPRKQIKVEIVDLKVTVNGDLATARFRQIYASDTLSTSSRKTLSLARSSQGKWVIKQEAVGG